MRVPALCGIDRVEGVTNPVFVADLHLTGRKPRTVLAFFRFLKTTARRYDSLFLLGDIFDYWVGDDAAGAAAPLVKRLQHYVASGRRVFLMQGNRDVMLGEDFARSCGAELLSPQCVLSCRDQRFLLSHGDQWCLLDTEYQQWRAMLRDPQWQRKMLDMTVQERIAWARDARSQSSAGKKTKTLAQMDVVDAAVQADALALNCQAVIHGHTHRPAVYPGAVPRYVLPDWDYDKVVTPRGGWVELNSQHRAQLVFA